jgi:capsular polysaccharide biosynthesis protein
VTTTTRPRAEPDLDAEREVDVGRYVDALVARWWLPVVGLLVGVAIGYLLSLGGEDVYRAQSTIYIGSPYAANGTVLLPASLTTNQSTINRIVRSEETIAEVARESGMTRPKLREGISTRQLRSGLGRTVPSQLYVVSVQGDERAEVQAAARALAERVVDRIDGPAQAKIRDFRQLLRSQNTQLEAIEQQVDAAQQLLAGAGSPTERLLAVSVLSLAEQRRGTLEEERIETRQLLAQAEEVELPGVLDRAVAAKTTARSTRNSVAIAGLIGLLVGLLAALFWEPLSARATRV